MKPCDPYLYEFLFRGRAPGDDTPAAWHVKIETRVEVGGGHVVPHERILNMQQAIDEGWDLKKIGAAINTDALSELEDVRSKVAVLEEENSDQLTEIQTLQAGVKIYDAQAEQLKAALADRTAAADGMAHNCDTLTAEVKRLMAVVDEQTRVVKSLKTAAPAKVKPARRRAPGRAR